jgi:phage-related minor tail protein
MESISNGTEKLSEGLVNVKSEADQLKEKFMEIGQGIEDGIVSGLTDAVMGTQTLAQAAIGVLNNLKRKLVEVAMQRAVSGIGNFFGNALSGIFGGGRSPIPLVTDTSLGSDFSNLVTAGAFANGGRPPVGRPSLVGEQGPEIFVPKVAGTIIPNNAIGGGGTTNNMITVNVDATGSSVQGNGSEADQLGGLIASVVQATIIDEQRAGGLLNR